MNEYLLHRNLRVAQTTYFSLITHAKQLSSVTLCETTAGIGKNGSVTDRRTYVRTDGRKDRQT